MKSDRRGGGRRYEWVERGVEREDLGGRKKKCCAWEGATAIFLFGQIIDDHR